MKRLLTLILILILCGCSTSSVAANQLSSTEIKQEFKILSVLTIKTLNTNLLNPITELKKISAYQINPEKSKKYARKFAWENYNWGKGQFSCLDTLWIRESNWRWDALNKSSGAYGLTQALPGYKMAEMGSDWRTNPQTQIRWGLKYIKHRYGSPCGALSHSYKFHWY